MAFHSFLSCISKKTPAVCSLRPTFPFRTSTWSQTCWTKVSKTVDRSRRGNLNHQATAQCGHSLHSWTYDEGCKKWPEKFPECGSCTQSPVSLYLCKAERKLSIAFLAWENLDERPSSMKLHNNGHTIELESTWPKGKTPIICLKNTGYKFEFSNIHWHWGTDSADGSEHEIDGKKAAMEMHLVFEQVAGKGQGTVSLAYGQLLKNDNSSSCTPSGITVVARSLEAVLENGAEKEIEPLPLRDFVHTPCKQIFSYWGSKTMPPCEPVLWLVAAESGVICDKEINAFRAVKNNIGKCMSGNIRPLQPFNDRKLTLFE